MSPSNTAHPLSREQRLRMQAELQSLYSTLVNLREREATFIEALATIPELLIKQVNEIRLEIEDIEGHLFVSSEETPEALARQFYWEAFRAELDEEFSKAIKLYRTAARYAHPDANAAIRRARYLMRSARSSLGLSKTWGPMSTGRSKMQVYIGLVAVLIIVLLLVMLFSERSLTEPTNAIAVEIAPVATATPPFVKLIIPDTATPVPSETSTPAPLPTATSQPLPTLIIVNNTATPISTPALIPAPRLIGPKNGLVWNDGAIVFEFEDLNLADDELYCLNTLRGYDMTNTELWSYPPTGNNQPFIPIQAHVFRIAKAQDIRCIVWSTSIGRGTCENIISESTVERVIGLPRPCEIE